MVHFKIKIFKESESSYTFSDLENVVDFDEIHNSIWWFDFHLVQLVVGADYTLS